MKQWSTLATLLTITTIGSMMTATAVKAADSTSSSVNISGGTDLEIKGADGVVDLGQTDVAKIADAGDAGVTLTNQQAAPSITVFDDKGDGVTWHLSAQPSALVSSTGNTLNVKNLTINGKDFNVDGTDSPIEIFSSNDQGSTPISIETSMTLGANKHVLAGAYSGTITWTLSADDAAPAQ